MSNEEIYKKSYELLMWMIDNIKLTVLDDLLDDENCPNEIKQLIRTNRIFGRDEKWHTKPK